MKILGLHLRDTKNIGDRACHPLDYFDLHRYGNFEILKADVRTLPPDYSPDLVVLGGGAIAKYAPLVVSAYPGAKLIGWGVGATSPEHAPVDPATHRKRSRGFQLWGARDYGSSKLYVPCASCMHAAFDEPAVKPEHDLVVFGHAGRASLREQAERLGVPYIENNDPNGFNAVIAHLRSGRSIVSSSFHGVYWSMMLNKKVSMIPFGSKFFGIKEKPPIAAMVEEGYKIARSYPSALFEARRINVSFFSRVLNFAADPGTISGLS